MKTIDPTNKGKKEISLVLMNWTFSIESRSLFLEFVRDDYEENRLLAETRLQLLDKEFDFEHVKWYCSVTSAL